MGRLVYSSQPTRAAMAGIATRRSWGLLPNQRAAAMERLNAEARPMPRFRAELVESASAISGYGWACITARRLLNLGDFVWGRRERKPVRRALFRGACA